MERYQVTCPILIEWNKADPGPWIGREGVIRMGVHGNVLYAPGLQG
jgi:hypothetical protein